MLNRAVGTETQVHSAACGVKVFKDKGGDRKQRQDLQKIEKLSKAQQVCPGRRWREEGGERA